MAFFLCAVAFSVGCAGGKQLFREAALGHQKGVAIYRDLPDICNNGTLRAIVGYNSTSYFIYKGQPMGYEYDLLQDLAKHMNLKLDIIVARNMDEVFSMLNDGMGDIIAYGLPVTKSRRSKVAFTQPHTFNRQMLVQRKPDDWRKMKLHDIDRQLIKNPVDLIGKEVYVRKNSAYYDRLINLSDELGGDIQIRVVRGDLGAEELVGMVANGDIDYTIADEQLALMSQTFYPQLDVTTAISLPQQIAWAVRKSSPQLLRAVNSWVEEMKGGATYYLTYNKYFRNKKQIAESIENTYYSEGGLSISRYDEDLRQLSCQVGWDWRLLASQVYQESAFDPHAVSWAGARGLLQLMPATAKWLGVKNIDSPSQNLQGGADYLQWLNGIWQSIPDSTERIKFVLASYNAGAGHVKDAQRLAKKYGRDPNKWEDNVAYFLLNKSKSKVYTDPVVEHGYCRGEEPVYYVANIINRYEHYQRFVK